MRKMILMAAILTLGGCSERWEGYAYANRHDLSNSTFVGEFKSLEECRRNSIGALTVLNSDTARGDYECGLDCVPKYGMRVCEKTTR